MRTQNISLERAKRYNPQYKSVSQHGYELKPADIMPIENEQLFETIFAPDPVTGVPRSDLAFVVNSETRPEVIQFIQNTLMRPQSESVKTDDVDLALASIRGRNETFVDYANRLAELSSRVTEGSK